MIYRHNTWGGLMHVQLIKILINFRRTQKLQIRRMTGTGAEEEPMHSG
jgi:hypothetical protein